MSEFAPVVGGWDRSLSRLKALGLDWALLTMAWLMKRTAQPR